MKFKTRCIAPLFILSALGIHTAVAEQTQAAAMDPNEPVTEQVQTHDHENADKQASATESGRNKTTEQPAAPAPAPAPAPEQTMTMSEVISLLQQQQQDLAEQKQLLQSQEHKISTLTRELDVLRAPPPTLSEQVVTADTPKQPLPPAIANEVVEVESGKSKEEKEVEAGESVAKAQTDDPTRALLEDFTGAWRLPGTDAALAIGGYVKTSIVYNNDPLEIKDRFIVGSIPVGDSGNTNVEAQSSITASQSRLNFDLREPTEYGILRAFIEGDFAEENDTFRLRHAFGQWKKMLAGKTWTTFQDTQASPEEVDFEGLNGRVNLRQSQVRLMPRLGEEYEFQFALEDPNPQVQNGSGVTRTPDLVAAGRFQPHDRLHVKLALLGREIRAQRLKEIGGGVEKKYAWGTTLSGRFMTPKFDERDNLLFQLNVGNGIGRYVNDLASVGSFDGIFNPENGDLELFDIIAGYISLQHWWGSNQMRSNFTFGAVEVDNPSFVEGDAYKRTLRFSSNLLWSPTPRIDIGGEYLWGNRKNEDGEDNTATQLQLAVRYRF